MSTLATVQSRLAQLKLFGMLDGMVARCEAARAMGQDPYDLLLA